MAAGDVMPLGEAADAQNEDNRPKCTTHRKFMNYNPAEDRMECPVQGCKKRAVKQRSFQNAVGSELTGKPVFYRGRVQFVTTSDGELGLYLVDANAVVSLESVKDAQPFSQNVDAASRALRFLDSMAHHLPMAAAAVERMERRKKQDAEAKRTEERFKRRQEERDQQRRRTNLAEGKYPSSQNQYVTIPPHLVARQKYIDQLMQESLQKNKAFVLSITPDDMYRAGCAAIDIIEDQDDPQGGSSRLRIYDAAGQRLLSVSFGSDGCNPSRREKFAMYQKLKAVDGEYCVYHGEMFSKFSLQKTLEKTI